MNNNLNVFYLFWFLIGGCLGFLSAYSHNLLTRYIVGTEDSKKNVSITGFVFLRVLIIAGVLFLAFSFDFVYGIICMISFFLLQWFCILVLYKGKRNNT